MKKIFYFFPFQLMVHLIKKNLALLLLWVFLIAMMLGGIGRVYGIHYLWLDPEYLHEVSFWSFFIIGLAFGNFIMSFHITSYILDGHHFSFVGVLERPFAKYSLNNSFIPLVVYLIYSAAFVHFQLVRLHTPIFNVFIFFIAFTVGILFMKLVMFGYFYWTNNDIFKYLAGSVDKTLRRSIISRNRVMNKLNETRQHKYPVKHYLDLKLRVRNCENFNDFYDKGSILKVFDQNHFNSVLLQLIIISLIFSLSVFLDSPFLQLPAAASALLLFSIVMMLVGAISYWFRSWGVALVFGLFILANVLAKSGLTSSFSTAKGLNYQTEKAEYSTAALQRIATANHIKYDSLRMIERLENWKAKQISEKPKLVMQAVSGGGQRAALWTLLMMHQLDSVTAGNFMKQTFMITGASGGLIGAAYYREIYRNFAQNRLDREISNLAINNIAKDNLNHVVFSLVIHDLFVRYQRYEYGSYQYIKDRGYFFEKQLSENTGGLLNNSLGSYYEEEQAASIPTLLLTPVISNDGRKLFISSAPMSFLMKTADDHAKFKIRGVDFNRFFEGQDPSNLNFITALRMSASFPYITPNITLPSEPEMEIMDAGVWDNFGITETYHFINYFQEWINQNTSGVIIVQIRDTKKNTRIPSKQPLSIVERLSNPISSVYNNMTNIQDIVNDNYIASLKRNTSFSVNYIPIELDIDDVYDDVVDRSDKDREISRASLSWRLTKQEKESIKSFSMHPSIISNYNFISQVLIN